MSRSFKVVEGDLKKKSDKNNDNCLIVLKVINFRNRFPFFFFLLVKITEPIC